MMPKEPPHESELTVTFNGQTQPNTKLMELVYDELRALAGSYLRSERQGRTHILIRANDRMAALSAR